MHMNDQKLTDIILFNRHPPYQPCHSARPPDTHGGLVGACMRLNRLLAGARKHRQEEMTGIIQRLQLSRGMTAARILRMQEMLVPGFDHPTF
jgi:hypothetical protein